MKGEKKMKAKKRISIVLSLALTFTSLSCVNVLADTTTDTYDLSEAVGGSLDAVETDFDLPSEIGGKAVLWTSNNEDAVFIVGNKAYVVNGVEDKAVTLTAKTSSGSVSYELTVPAAKYTGEYFLNESFETTEEAALPSTFQFNEKFKHQGTKPEDGDWYFGVKKDEDNSYLRIFKKANCDMYTANGGMPNVFAMATSTPDSGNVVVKYSYNMVFSAAGSSIMNARITNGTTAALGSDFQRIENSDTGSGTYYNHVWTTQGADSAATKNQEYNKWHSVVIDANLSSGTYDYYYDKEKLGNGLKSRGGTIKNMAFGWDTGAARGGELYLDDVQVYLNGAKTALDNIDIASDVSGDIVGLTSAVSVIKNASNEKSDVAVTYISSDTSVVENDGTVHHPYESEGEAKVSLYAVANDNGLEAVKKFNLTVSTIPDVYDNDVQAALAKIDLDSLSSGYTESFTLPQTIGDSNDITVSWTSDNSDAILISGTTAYVINGIADKKVTLTATATDGSIAETKKFDIIVPEAYTGTAYYLNENFETTEVSALPDTFKVNSLFLTANGNKADSGDNRWYFGVQSTDDNKYLRVYKAANASMWTNNGGMPNVFAMATSTPDEGNLVVKYRYNISSLAGSQDVMNARITNGTTAALGTDYKRIAAGDNANGEYNLVWNGWDDRIQKQAYGVWHEVALDTVVSATANNGQKFDFVFDGKLIKSNVETHNTSSTTIKNLAFGWDTTASKGGEMFIDDVKVFYNTAKSAYDKLTAAALGIKNESAVASNLNLPQSIETTDSTGATINAAVTYISSDPAVLAADGTVKNAEIGSEKKNVTLYAVVSSEGIEYIKAFNLTVLPKLYIARTSQTDNSITAGENTITYEVVNNTGDKVDLMVIEAGYKGEAMTNCGYFQYMTIPKDYNDTQPITCNVESGADKIKIFMWDKNFAPICAPDVLNAVNITE